MTSQFGRYVIIVKDNDGNIRITSGTVPKALYDTRLADSRKESSLVIFSGYGLTNSDMSLLDNERFAIQGLPIEQVRPKLTDLVKKLSKGGEQ